MDKEKIFTYTKSYDEELIEDLKDPEEARAYVEASLDEYEKDGDTTALLLALRSVAEAQGGIGKLAQRAGITPEHLFEVLNSKHHPQLDTLLSMLSTLGFRMKSEQVQRVEPATRC